jgi:hypothetical protein
MKFIFVFVVLIILVNQQEARPQLDCKEDKNNKFKILCVVDLGTEKVNKFVKEFGEKLHRARNPPRFGFGFNEYKAKDLSYLKNY